MMNFWTLKRLTTFFVAALFWMTVSPIVSGQSFKIETAIYAGDEKTPVAQNITLFQGDLIVDLKVDFANPPNVLETKIYDARQKKVSLLDHERSIQVEISDNHLLQMVDGLRRDISQRESLKFLVNESFAETQQLELSKLVLTSPTIRYEVEGTRPTDTAILQSHNEFLEIFTRLSASTPGGFPPFARLRLNQSIKQLGWIPSSVRIKIAPNVMMPDGLEMKSTHVLIESLSENDIGRIETAKKEWLGYARVNLLKFRGIDTTATLEETVDESSQR